MLPGGAFEGGLKPCTLKRNLLRFKGLYDLGRQAWKLANIERF
jgi:hypothetical protein